jgi:hypothetical protein
MFDGVEFFLRHGLQRDDALFPLFVLSERVEGIYVPSSNLGCPIEHY